MDIYSLKAANIKNNILLHFIKNVWTNCKLKSAGCTLCKIIIKIYSFLKYLIILKRVILV